MLTPDLDLGRRFLDSVEVPGRPLLCAVTGAHLYGFPSEDSDLDLKGVFLAPTERLLGLDPPGETLDALAFFEGHEMDLTLHEARKALHLLLRGNGNLAEQILSPLQVLRTPEVDELASLARGALSRRFVHHYRGFFARKRAEHERDPTPRAKTLLYAYRVALTGLHLMRTGELEADLRTTAPEHGFAEALELVALKLAQPEKGRVPADVDARHRQRWPALEAALTESVARSPLPEDAPNRAALDDFLVRARRAGSSG